MRAIILAGGYARRLWPITRERAKPLLPVAGRPIIEYVLERLPEELGSPIISINRRFAQEFERWRRGYPRQVELVVEETLSEEEKLGAVGALAFLIEELRLSEDLLILGGDNIFEFDLKGFLEAYHGRPLIALHDLGDLERVRLRYGVAIVEDGRIVEFQEKPKEPRSALVSTACYLYPARILPLVREFLAQAQRGKGKGEGEGEGKDAPGYFNEWLLTQKREPLEAFVFQERWFDIGDRASYIEANLHYLELDGREQELWTGEGVVIERSQVRRSVIFDRVRIEDSLIEECVIDSDVELERVELRGALIGRGTSIKGEPLHDEVLTAHS